jgi:hypothetical protein
MKRVLFLVLFIGFLIPSLRGQMIDSVLYHPYPSVDSIEYWHIIENKDNKLKETKGYFLNCLCATKKNRTKVITSEGIQSSNNEWEWTYYNDVRKSCCSEFLLYADSTVTFINNHRIKKIDHNAEYRFIPPDSLYATPFLKDRAFKYEVKCDRSNCTTEINSKYILKTFPIKDLEMELLLISQDKYNHEVKQMIQKKTKR